MTEEQKFGRTISRSVNHKKVRQIMVDVRSSPAELVMLDALKDHLREKLDNDTIGRATVYIEALNYWLTHDPKLAKVAAESQKEPPRVTKRTQPFESRVPPHATNPRSNAVLVCVNERELATVWAIQAHLDLVSRPQVFREALYYWLEHDTVIRQVAESAVNRHQKQK